MLYEDILVTIGQASHVGTYGQWIDSNRRCRIRDHSKQFDSLYKTIDTAKKDCSQFVLFPELFLPRDFLHKHIKAICEENQFIMIGGLEYGPRNVDENDKEIPLQNEAFIAIPQSLERKANSHAKRHCTLFKISKILPAEDEEQYLNKHNYTFQKGNKIYVFESEIIGNWAVLICSDFLNLPIHVLLQSNIQTLFIVSYNKDVNGYTSIADSIQRLSMCNVIICNMGVYGSSLAFSPYRTDFLRQIVKVTGNGIDMAVTIKLPLKNLKLAQDGHDLKDFKGEQMFIKRPPDFGKFQIMRSE